MRRSIASILVLAVAAIAVSACHKTGPNSGAKAAEGASSSSSSPVVARYQGGEITAAQVDAHILALSAKDRPQPGDDLGEWYKKQIREVAVDRLLLAAAQSHYLEKDGDFLAAQERAEREIGLQLCLSEKKPDIVKITEADLRAEYKKRAKDLSAPERRTLYEIFLHRRPGALAEIRSLRNRVLNGQNFFRLATKYSESETRHRKGFVGWIVPGELPSGFEKIVFHLKEGVPSEPVVTRQGYELFYVDNILPAKHLSFKEARPILFRRLQLERWDAALSELDAKTKPPAGSLILNRKQLAAALKAGDPKAPVLRIGKVSWTVGDLQRRAGEFLARHSDIHGKPTFALAWQILDHARRREELYESCKSEGHIPAKGLEKRLSAWQEKTLTDLERQRRLVTLATKDKDRLHLFYESNIGMFSTLPTWTIRRLRVPLGRDPMATMDRLEAAAKKPGTKLSALEAELGGKIDKLGPISLAEIARVEPKLPKLLAPLEPGQLSAPYRTEDGLEITEVVARTKAKPLAFDEVRDRVAVRYVRQYTARLYAKMSEKMLQDIHFRIDPNAVTTLRKAGMPEPDISVRQLETLLDRI